MFTLKQKPVVLQLKIIVWSFVSNILLCFLFLQLFFYIFQVRKSPQSPSSPIVVKESGVTVVIEFTPETSIAPVTVTKVSIVACAESCK